ncbi:MAG TPA: amino acid ABC transporter permease [Coriobacteriia bacterium]|nr:amino acid ABC transporter permease [Coriobacteriia bacterium]
MDFRATTKAHLGNRVLVVALLSLALTLVFSALLPMQSADALTTDAVTAKRNEDGGSAIIGGKAARLTWTGFVDENEKVMRISLTFPEGSGLAEDARVDVQEMIMDDPLHPVPDHTVKYTDDLTAEGLVLVFEDGLRPNNKVLIRVEGFLFPNATGEYSITGTYVDEQGTPGNLEADDPIAVTEYTQMQALVDDLNGQEWVQAWNSNKFLSSFLNPAIAVASVPNLFWGWLISLALVALGFPLAIPIGLGVAFLRMSKLWILKFISSIYVNVIRGTPLFLQIYIAFFGLPLFIPNVNVFVLGFGVLALNSSAYLAEIFRAGIQSIHKGQFEASASLGMNGAKTMFFVIIPQTIRRVIPTMTSEFILLFKDTSLLAAVGFFEMMQFAKVQANVEANMTPYVVAAGFYLLVTLPLTRVISVFEKKLAATDGRTAAPDDKKSRAKRVGLFKTVAPLSATTSDPNVAITPEKHDSR